MSEHSSWFPGLRTVTDADIPVLQDIYVSTRWEELQQAPWDDAQRLSFLHSQFDAQHQHYREHFTQASWLVVESDGTVCGRLYLDQRADELRIIDIALLPAFRNQGLGSSLLTAVIKQANQLNLPVRIHVEKNNPAMRLYLRLGFIGLEDAGVYLLMERPVAALA